MDYASKVLNSNTNVADIVDRVGEDVERDGSEPNVLKVKTCIIAHYLLSSYCIENFLSQGCGIVVLREL